MLSYIPAETVGNLVGEGGWGSVMLASVVGIPAYLNGYAALPLVAGLIEQGMAPGAGMAFLLAGGVSSIPAAIAVWALARPQVFLLISALLSPELVYWGSLSVYWAKARQGRWTETTVFR